VVSSRPWLTSYHQPCAQVNTRYKINISNHTNKRTQRQRGTHPEGVDMYLLGAGAFSLVPLTGNFDGPTCTALSCTLKGEAAARQSTTHSAQLNSTSPCPYDANQQNKTRQRILYVETHFAVTRPLVSHDLALLHCSRPLHCLLEALPQPLLRHLPGQL
jgi:hypothetical protein